MLIFLQEMINLNDERKLLIETIDIVDEIGSHIELTKKGNNYVGLCPFHTDNNPSFTVSSSKQIYKCFVCGSGGDVVKFYKMFNNISNQAAMSYLAKKYKIKLRNQNSNIPQLKPVNYVLNDINRFYVTALQSTAGGNRAIEYLTKRGFSSDTITHFHIGYGNDDNTKLYEYLNYKITTENKYNEFDVEKINQFNFKKDIFVNRVTIPIFKNNKIVGFGGRALGEENPKYLNSKDSVVFSKKKTLYHFDEAIYLSPDRSLIIVEGFFDVIKAYEQNIKNVVALMGVSFASEHITKMRQKQIDTIYLGLDMDRAGRDSTMQLGRVLIANQFKVKVLNYDRHKDLDEFLNDNNYEQFISIQKNSINFKLFETEQIIENISMLSSDEKNDAINQILTNLNIENEFVIEQVFSLLETNFNVSRQFLSDLQLKLNSQNPSIQTQNFNHYDEQLQQYNEQYDNQIDQNLSEESDPQVMSQIVVNTKGIAFMTKEQEFILRMLDTKVEFNELKKLKQMHQIKLKDYEVFYDKIDEYYKSYEVFDFMVFTDLYPRYSFEINAIMTKQFTNKSLSNEKLINELKEKDKWKIF